MKNKKQKRVINELKTYNYPKAKLKIKTMFFLFFSLAMSINWVNAQPNPKITDSDKVNSDSFKAKVGIARLVEFKKLESLIIPKSTAAGVAPEGEHFIGQYAMTETELVFLLGAPDVKVSSVIYQYNLGNGNSSCKLYVGIDSDGYVTYSVIKSCN